MKCKTSRGRVTLPAETGMEKEIKILLDKLGADAVRDSDGTHLSKEIMEMGCTVYKTLCLIRADLEWAKKHRDHLQQMYLMAGPVTAFENTLEIRLMDRFSLEQFELDLHADIKKYWQVIDRTTGDVVDAESWNFVPETGSVIIKNAVKTHLYTVSFLVNQIWDITSMYNHITNNWTGEHLMPLDPRHPETGEHLLEVLNRWLAENPEADVVRFTTFAYHFPIIHGSDGKAFFADWYGYMPSVSRIALDEFEKEKGYRLTAEDFVDNGYYCHTGRLPSARFWTGWISSRSMSAALRAHGSSGSIRPAERP